MILLSEFNEFLFAVGKPVGWDEETYRNDQKLQDIFLEELNLPTYNGFRELLFWDVVQGLAKIKMIRMHQEKEYKELYSIHTD